jgi:hypothetical protein
VQFVRVSWFALSRGLSIVKKEVSHERFVSVVFSFVFGSILGMLVRSVLPECHLSPKSKDIITLGDRHRRDFDRSRARPTYRLGTNLVQ